MSARMSPVGRKMALVQEAHEFVRQATLARKGRDKAGQDAALRNARDLFRAAGQTGMVLWCERFIG
jgi:hypothetical protein